MPGNVGHGSYGYRRIFWSRNPTVEISDPEGASPYRICLSDLSEGSQCLRKKAKEGCDSCSRPCRAIRCPCCGVGLRSIRKGETIFCEGCQTKILRTSNGNNLKFYRCGVRSSEITELEVEFFGRQMTSGYKELPPVPDPINPPTFWKRIITRIRDIFRSYSRSHHECR